MVHAAAASAVVKKGIEIGRVQAHTTVATVQEATATVVAPVPTHPQSY